MAMLCPECNHLSLIYIHPLKEAYCLDCGFQQTCGTYSEYLSQYKVTLPELVKKIESKDALARIMYAIITQASIEANLVNQVEEYEFLSPGMKHVMQALAEFVMDNFDVKEKKDGKIHRFKNFIRCRKICK